jgi:murein L,D-transpeptidase YcbB/YkuD
MRTIPVAVVLGALIVAPTIGQAAAPVTPLPAPKPSAKPEMAGVSKSPIPTFDAGTYGRIGETLLSYSAIDVRGGWPAVPGGVELAPGAQGPAVAVLRQRLAISDDLDPGKIAGDVYDEDLAVAVRKFQARHGLAETGSVGKQTLAALNIPVKQRLKQLAASLDRLGGMSFSFAQRYVVVNIPAAFAEAIEGDKVARRYVVVVGKPDRASPTLTTHITAVNLNPTWTVPLSIVKKDIMTKMRKDPTYVSRMHMKLLDANGGEISPSSVDWKSDRSPNFTIRQDSGNHNALGNVRIDMPNPHSVYMHDTNHRNLFSSDYRFHSSGCARVADVRDLAAWLLQDNPGWRRPEIDAAIAKGGRTDVRLPRGVPVAWLYLTGWVTRDGTVHFRPDVYDHDDDQKRPLEIATSQQPIAVAAARASGFVLQSATTRPVRFEHNSYLDSR